MSRTAMLPNSAAYDGPINISSSLSTTYDQTTVSRWFRDDGSVIESQRRFGDVEDWIQYSLDLKAPSGNHQMPSQFQTVYMFSYTSGKVSESSVCSKELPLENVETDGDMIELLQSEWSTLIGWRSLWLRLYAFRYVKIRNLVSWDFIEMPCSTQLKASGSSPRPMARIGHRVRHRRSSTTRR